MMQKAMIRIAGGDLRMLYAAQMLQKDFMVQTEGFSKEKLPEEIQQTVESCGKLVESADVLILPPVSVDAYGQIPAPYGDEPLKPEQVLSGLKTGGSVFGGNDKGMIRRLCAENGFAYENYINSSALAQANAVPTAEGALKIALEQTGRTIWNSRVLVTGCGRIGTLLANRLHALGACVTAAARQAHDRVRMRTMGLDAVPIPLDAETLSGYDLIFNTVPAEIFKKEHLQKLRADCLLIDLASSPGGASRNAIEESGCRYVWAPGLPPAVMS
ncbi:MAG: dipicolinate synthase subunit DpsA [Ruminococcus sp.]